MSSRNQGERWDGDGDGEDEKRKCYYIDADVVWYDIGRKEIIENLNVIKTLLLIIKVLSYTIHPI